MITSRARLPHTVAVIFVAILCLAYIVFGLCFFLATEIDNMSIIVGAFIVWFGIGFLSLILKNNKTVTIDTDYITIKTHFGIITNRYRFEDIRALNFKPLATKWKHYPGLLIKFRNNRKVHIHSKEFENFHEIQRAITNRVNRYEKMKIEIWTPAAMRFLIAGVLILAALLVARALEL